MLMMKIAAIGIIGTVLSVAVKKEMPVFSALIGLATGIIILLYTAEEMKTVIEVLDTMIKEAGVNKTYMSMVIKITGIAYVTQFCSDICDDAGEKAVANKIDLAGKVAIAFIASPIILSLMEAVMKYI